MVNKCNLIELSSEEYNSSDSNTSVCESSEKESEDKDSEDKDSEDDKIILFQNDNTDIEDDIVMEFIEFCIKNNIFDNTFYDYGNAFSIVATKLPKMFEKMSKEYKYILKEDFINVFINEYDFEGDIEYIYNYVEKEEEERVTIDELLDFFLLFVKYTTF